MIRTRFVSALLTALAIPTILAASENNAANSGPARPPAVQAGTPYYIEFRVARIGTYGHSYVAYGRLNARASPPNFDIPIFIRPETMR